MARFLVEEEGRPTRSYRLETDAIIVGRSDSADLVLPDTDVSRKHALVERTETGWAIQDSQSGNGFTVNGEPSESHALAHGDVVAIGKFTLVFQTDDEADLPEYDGADQEGGEDQTYPRLSVPDIVPAAPAPPTPAIPEVTQPYLLGAHEERFEIVANLRFGREVPVSGVLPFLSAGSVVPDGDGIAAHRGSFLIPMYLNGASVVRQRLQEGDELRVGSSRFTYHGP